MRFEVGEVRKGHTVRIVYENKLGGRSEASGEVTVVEDGHVYFMEPLPPENAASEREIHVEPNGSVLINSDNARGYRDRGIGKLRGVVVE